MIGQLLSNLRTSILDTLVIAVTLTVSYFVIADVNEGTYLIEPISVPEDFQKEVQDKDGVAAHLRDAIGILSQRARDGVAIRPTVEDPSEPKVSITGTSFSIRDIAIFIREHFGEPYTIITGELSVVKGDVYKSLSKDTPQGTPKPRVHLTLRLSDTVTGPIFDEEGEYDDVIHKAAIETLHKIDPYTAGVALAQGDHAAKEKGLSWIVEALNRAEADDSVPRHRRMFGLNKVLPRAKLALANVLLSLEEFDKAIQVFGDANKAYVDRDPSRKEWAFSYDGIATAYLLISENDWTDYKETGYTDRAKRNTYNAAVAATKKSVARSMEIDPTYDSALYHLAQIYDAEARHWFDQKAQPTRSQFSTLNCKGMSKFRSAMRYYDSLTTLHPSFAVAYSNKAVLIMQKLRWVRSNRKNLRCVPAKDTAQSLELTLFNDARSSFDLALARDEQLPAAWWQRGILFVEQQDPEFAINTLKVENRPLILKIAIANFERATVLAPWDAYVWERLADARRQLARLGGDDCSRLNHLADEALRTSAAKRNEARFSGGALPSEAFEKTEGTEQAASQGSKGESAYDVSTRKDLPVDQNSSSKVAPPTTRPQSPVATSIDACP